MAAGLWPLVLLGAACAATGSVGVQPLRAQSHPGRGGASPNSVGVGETGTESPNADILTAWRSAEQAFDSAALTADPTEPALPATTVDPQLSFTKELLGAMQASGQLARGAVSYGQPVVVAETSSEATVRSCLHDAEIVFDRATGLPVPGIEGEVADELVVSLMLRTDGGWKLSDQTVRANVCVPR